MNQLDRYLARMFLARFAVTVLALVMLLGVLDALSNADLLPNDHGLTDQLRYMGLRMPILFDRMMILALLLALLLTYVGLIRRNELVAIAGAGVSVFGQVRALALPVAMAAILSAVLIDRMTPPVTRALTDWLGPEAVVEDGATPQTLWLADGDLLVEVGGLRGRTLHDVTLFERGDDGRIMAVTQADTAVAVPEGWTLLQARQIRYDGQPVQVPELWATAQTPHTLRLLLSEPRYLALDDLLRLSRMTGSGSLPSNAYLVWFMNRLALPFVALGFLMLTVPIMQRFGRHDGGEVPLGIGVGAGFLFMVVDGMLKTLAESGSVAAATAVAIPAGAVIVTGLWLCVHKTMTS